MTFSPWVKVYGKLGFWLKACRTAGHDICQGLASGSGMKGMSHIYSHDTHATMMIRKFHAKLVMHAPILCSWEFVFVFVVFVFVFLECNLCCVLRIPFKYG